MSFSNGSYNLLAVPINTGCTSSFRIEDNTTTDLPLIFTSEWGASTPTVTIAPDFPPGTLDNEWTGFLYRYGSTTDFIRFIDTSPPGKYGADIKVLAYHAGATQAFRIQNYGAAYVSANRLVSLYGEPAGEQTFLARNTVGALVAVIGTASAIYLAVAEGHLVEPIPVVWNFQTLLPITPAP